MQRSNANHYLGWVGRRVWIALGLAAVLAGCGGSSKPEATATPAAAAEPSAITGCSAVGPGWRPLAVRLHRESIDAAMLGDGRVGVVFANESGNSACDWLPFAAELARRGDRVAVFSYAGGAPAAELLAVARSLRVGGARRIGIIGASVGGRAVIQAAAHNPPDIAAAISLSAERSVAALPEILPAARRIHVPSFYIGSRQDGYTTFGRETRDFHRVTPARVNKMLLVPGGDHGVDLLSDRYGPRVRAAIEAFLTANAR
jgi:dienelactone hydrolase